MCGVMLYHQTITKFADHYTEHQDLYYQELIIDSVHAQVTNFTTSNCSQL